MFYTVFLLCSNILLLHKHTGAKKHEAAMKEMARRKNENSRKPGKAGNIGISAAARNTQKQKVVLPQRGIAAGVKNKNKHLQEFENMKAKYRQRKGNNLLLL